MRNRLEKFFMFDGLTLLNLLAWLGLAYTDVFWIYLSRLWYGQTDELLMPPAPLRLPIEIFLVVFLTFFTTYQFRRRRGFERARLKVVIGVIAAGAVVIGTLHLLGIINIIPG